MSAQSRIAGLDSTLAFVERLAPAAREQMAVELAIMARELSAAQKADVAKDTGALESSLTYQIIPESLRARIGLLRGQRDAKKFNGRVFKGRSGGPFYGRFVEFGRAAQTVAVTRHIKVRVLKGNNRKGNTRRTIYGGKAYTMRVKAMAARPFVAQPILQQVADSHLADFWSKVISRAGG